MGNRLFSGFCGYQVVIFINLQRLCDGKWFGAYRDFNNDGLYSVAIS